MSQPPKKPAPYHFIGIGGVGMSGLAQLLQERGLATQGSDRQESATTRKLSDLGITIFTGHDASHVGNASTVVVSSAIPDDNPELVEAKKLGLNVVHRSDVLAELIAQKQGITIAGTHGKSTTTGLVAHILEQLNVDPTTALGGTLLQHGTTAHSGQGDFFIAEADESDGSLLKYRPYISVLTNIDDDHLENFGSIEKVQDCFRQYLDHTDPEGTAVIGWDNSFNRDLCQSYAGPRLTFGFVIGSEVRGLNYRVDQGATEFEAVVERDLIKARMPLIGRHNVSNALAALAVVRALELDVNAAAQALATFPGVGRRQERVHESDQVTIIDDYAHNPGKIAACIDAIKEGWPDRAVHVVFQAHRYSRLETMYEGMLGSLARADFTYVLPVYAAGETTDKDYSAASLAAAIAEKNGNATISCESFADAVREVEQRLEKPAIILTVGAGDVWQVARLLREAII